MGAALDRLDLRVMVMVATRKSGQPAADLPQLGIPFDHPDGKELPDLVRRYALHKLEGMTPEQVAGYLPPAEAALDTVPVRAPGATASPACG